MENNALSVLYKDIKCKLEAANYRVSDARSIDYGVQFFISSANWSSVIRIYQSKKGSVKIDFSQIRDIAQLNKVQSILHGPTAQSVLPSTEINTIDEVDGVYPIIGTDESGKGDYFGPLVSAGICLDEMLTNKLRMIGVRDSKELTDSKNIELAKKISDYCFNRFSVIEISPEKYNNLYDKFRKEGKNLNTLLAWGHAKAIEEILGRVPCEVAIADQFADESFIESKLQERGKRIKLVQRHKAEQNTAVAAASILARARFLEKLHKYSLDYGLQLPKGASQAVIVAAKSFIHMHGNESLFKVAKLHFKITSEVLSNRQE